MCYPRIDFLFLNEKDMIRAGVTKMDSCIDAMEEVVRCLNAGDYVMGGENHNSHGSQVSFPVTSVFPNMPLDRGDDRRFMAMPAYIGGSFDMMGMKWYGSNSANKEKGLPRSILTLMLNDKDTGAPLALMSANLLSAYRTGAIPGVGARYLARKGARVAGICGPGVMGKTSLEAILCTCPEIDTVKVKGRGRASLNAFVEYVKNTYPKLKNVYAVDSVEALVRDSDVISFANSCNTNPKTYPFVKKDWVNPSRCSRLTIRTRMLFLPCHVPVPKNAPSAENTSTREPGLRCRFRSTSFSMAPEKTQGWPPFRGISLPLLRTTCGKDIVSPYGFLSPRYLKYSIPVESILLKAGTVSL